VKILKAVPKKENFKLTLRIPEIKSLLNATNSLCDKAIVLTLFQSGMSINERCNLTYGDLSTGLQTNEEPLNLHLIRKKEQVEYVTFLGADSNEAIKAYLAQRQRNEETLQHSTPLFILQFTTKPKSSKYKKINQGFFLYEYLLDKTMKISLS
jgi:integrase/recombinase XerD